MKRELTDEERRELEIVSLAFQLQDEECDEPIEGNELRGDYYELAKETLYGKESGHGAR